MGDSDYYILKCLYVILKRIIFKFLITFFQVAKSYDHVKELMIAVVKQKENTKASDELAFYLPQQAKNIAKGRQPPKEDVVARHRSRFQKQ